MDAEFIAEMLERYLEHLKSVEMAISRNITSYEKSLNELDRLSRFKPEVYEKELEKMHNKIKEADIKLSYIVPRMVKIMEQIEVVKLIK